MLCRRSTAYRLVSQLYSFCCYGPHRLVLAPRFDIDAMVGDMLMHLRPQVQAGREALRV